ncbi:MAG: RHS repeat-associated core domain-containing protein [Bacteroidales bacterium]|nr:RHS repeat-associated core domain-containing protein [Bacteroidales bacterium]
MIAEQSVKGYLTSHEDSYCGHEHLPEFNLLNMNARLYDPWTARFLSPDPYARRELGFDFWGNPNYQYTIDLEIDAYRAQFAVNGGVLKLLVTLPGISFQPLSVPIYDIQKINKSFIINICDKNGTYLYPQFRNTKK